MKERPDMTRSDSRSVKQILQDIVDHISDIVRSEVRLATTEVRQDLMVLAKAGMLIGIAAVLVFYGVGFVLLGGVYALQNVVPPWLAAVIVGVSVGIVAAILFATGRRRFEQASLRPNKTIQSLEDNVRWFKTQTK